MAVASIPEEEEQGQGQRQGLRRGNDARPVPDPTVLTTAALAREIGSLKELLLTRIESIEQAIRLFNDNLTRVPTALDKEAARLREGFADKFTALEREMHLNREVIETRLEASDKAIQILQNISDLFPGRIDEKIASLKAINEGEFGSVQVQFRERDVRTEAAASATKIAVDAALQAAKEAVQEQNRSSALAIAKSEASTDKRIDGIAGLIATTTKGTDEKIDDLKQRFALWEGARMGQIETKSETHTSSNFTATLVSIGIAVISALIAVAALMLRAR